MEHPSTRRRSAALTFVVVLLASLLLQGGRTEPVSARSPGQFAGTITGAGLGALSPDPIRQWGVVGPPAVIGESYPRPHVWAFAEIGDRIYVGGTFTGVQRYGFDPTSTVIGQRFLAAFDRDTGNWISSFRPTLDAPVLTLAVSPTGRLLVGGEFTTVNGVARRGLAMLDATTGATRTGWSTVVSGPASTSATPGSGVMVRKLIVDRGNLYVVGQFSRVTAAGVGYPAWNAVRVRADTGALDTAWSPRFAGSVWDLAVDPGRGRVHAVGFFTSAGAMPNTNRMATVTEATGAVVGNLPQLEFNQPEGQIDTVAVAFAGDKIWVGGAQHVLQVLDPVGRQRLAYFSTGISCDTFQVSSCPFRAGGDVQTLEVVGDLVIAGCHCFRSSESNLPSAGPQYDGTTHYSSTTGLRQDLRVAVAYDATTMRPASTFVPGLAKNYYGTWALHVDARGCYYVGGFYERSAKGDWVGGFGRFCRPTPAPTSLTANSADGTVHLSWVAPASQLPIVRYRVERDGVFIGDATGRIYVDVGRAVGAAHTYRVRTVDSGGRMSAPVQVAVTVGGVDTTAPSTPTSLSGTVSGANVTLRWNASTDAGSGIGGYLVHRDGTFLAWVPTGTTWTDSGVAAGSRRYEVRSQDRSRNNSAPAAVTVVVG